MGIMKKNLLKKLVTEPKLVEHLLDGLENRTENPVCMVSVLPEQKNLIIEVCNYETVNPIILEQVEEFIEDEWEDWVGLPSGIYKMELTLDGFVDYWGEVETWLKIISYKKYKLVLEEDGGKKENKI